MKLSIGRAIHAWTEHRYTHAGVLKHLADVLRHKPEREPHTDAGIVCLRALARFKSQMLGAS